MLHAQKLKEILHAVWDVDKPLHIKFSLHVLGTQHVMNTADEISRKLSLKLSPIL